MDASKANPKAGGNILDSSAPSRRRGKEREVPKAKRSVLRKHILREKEQHLQEPQQSPHFSEMFKNETEEISKEDKIAELATRLLHTKHYRQYCEQALTKDINELTIALLSDLVRFQDRAHQQNPIKAKMKRRLGFGMREVSKDVELGRVQCLIVAPDVAKFNVLDRTIEKLLESCKEHETPVVFALSRFHLGKVCKKRGYVTCVAVFNYDGSQDNFKKLMERVKEARLKYDEIISTAKEQLNSMDETELSNLADLFASECIIPPICQKMQRELIPSNKDYYSSCRIFPQKTNSSTSTDVKKVSRS